MATTARVPLGLYKIGQIASGKELKFRSDDVTIDPQVHNHQWAKDLGLKSFAGYKLRDDAGAAIGVLAAFSQHELSDEDDALLLNLAELTSRVILYDKVNEALHASERRLRLFVKNISDVIWTMDSAGRFTYFSPIH